MSEDLQRQRVEKRHEGEEKLIQYLNALHKYYEPVQKGEENAYDLEITDEMTADDVAEKVIELIENLNELKSNVPEISQNDKKATKFCNLF